jgi:hypothetical protein
MKKWLFVLLVLTAIPVLSFGGFGGEDVGKVRPVEVLTVCAKGSRVQLLTDTGDIGIGEDIPAAVRDLNETAQAKLLLDTVDYLLTEPGAEIWISQLQEYLRPSCYICYVTGDMDLKQVSPFLQIHEPEMTLNDYQAGERRYSHLIANEGRMKLVRP